MIAFFGQPSESATRFRAFSPRHNAVQHRGGRAFTVVPAFARALAMLALAVAPSFFYVPVQAGEIPDRFGGEQGAGREDGLMALSSIVDKESVSPVTNVTARDIERTGGSSVGDILKNLTVRGASGQELSGSAQLYSVGRDGSLTTVGTDKVLVDGTSVVVAPQGGIGVGAMTGPRGTLFGEDLQIIRDLPLVELNRLGSEFSVRDGGGVIDIVIKATPGSLYAVGSIASLQPFGGIDVGVTLGGPIVKDRLWFFRSDQPSGAAATPPAGGAFPSPLFSWKPLGNGTYGLEARPRFSVDFRLDGLTKTGASGFQIWSYPIEGGPSIIDQGKPLSIGAGDFLLFEMPGYTPRFLGSNHFGKPVDPYPPIPGVDYPLKSASGQGFSTWEAFPVIGADFPLKSAPARFGTIDIEWEDIVPRIGLQYALDEEKRTMLNERYNVFGAGISGVKLNPIIGRDGTYIGDEVTVPYSAGAPPFAFDFATIDFSKISVQTGSRIWFPSIPWQMYGSPPADPYLGSKGSWGQADDDLWGLKRVRADWSDPALRALLPREPAPVVVAIVDSGIDPEHPDLVGALWTNDKEIPGNGVDDDHNGFVDDRHGWNFVDGTARPLDDCGHGTAIAGIIAARAGNGTGIAGVNPWARIMPLKVLDHRGRGSNIDAVRAIVYATDNGARVINLSLGGRVPTPLEARAVAYAVRRGALVVAAAGNDGAAVALVSPAGIPGVVAVSSSGPDDARANFSNWGRAIALSAPGLDILSLRAQRTDLLVFEQKDYRPGLAFVGADREYYRVEGTSFSAPFVSGAAALLIARDPALPASLVARVLQQSARDIDVPGKDQYSGYGLLDVAAALRADPRVFVEAEIGGVQIVREGKEALLAVSGTVDADRFRKAWVEVGAGESPSSWKSVAKPITAAVRDGRLAEIPAREFAGARVWTIRLFVEHTDGSRREARYKLNVQ